MENHPLIFHISGITDLYKEQLMSKLKNLNKFLIFNLDDETEKIYKLPEIQTKLKDINEVKTTTRKKLESEVNDMWVIKINEYIKKIIKETETKNCFGIIFIGNTINMKYMRNKVIIPCYQKFFLEVNFEHNAKEIIKYNDEISNIQIFYQQFNNISYELYETLLNIDLYDKYKQWLNLYEKINDDYNKLKTTITDAESYINYNINVKPRINNLKLLKSLYDDWLEYENKFKIVKISTWNIYYRTYLIFLNK
jgi:hypothetical protein